MRLPRSGLVVLGLSWLLGGASLGTAAPPGPAPLVLKVRVDGLTCPFCAYGIEKRVKRLEAVVSYRVDVKSGEVELVAEPGRAIPPGTVREAISQAGFTPRGLTLVASGALEHRNGTPVFTLAAVRPAVSYPVSKESKVETVREAARVGSQVRVTGRLVPVVRDRAA